MEKDELKILQLRDCFTVGYTLPQYCIDNNIKRPLFVTEKRFEQFIWQIYVQFSYDKRIEAQFSIFDEPTFKLRYSVHDTFSLLKLKELSNELLDDCDKIIVISSDKNKVKNEKAIYLDKLTDEFIRKVYYEIPILHFMQRYPKVKLITTNFPWIGRYKDGLEFNKQLKTLEEMWKLLRNTKDNSLKTPLDKFGYTTEQDFELMEIFKTKSNPDGTTVMEEDDTKPLRRIKDSKRATAYQPETYRNKIYFFGSCHQFGINAPFDKTIESYLQKMLNEHNLPYRVENEGQYYFGRYQDMFYNLNALNPEPSDIIFIWTHGISLKNIPFCDVSNAFDPPHDYKEIFCVQGHVNELGYKLVAEKYFKYLTENNFFHDKEFKYPLPPPRYHRYGIPSWVEQGGIKSDIVNAELEAYKQQLKTKRPQIGALVMNCNPFTLGHQYLVEYAAARVDKLYIFVVKEDKSEFPFADRIELVRQGVKNFSNVEVLPSGKFIISQTTFSGYFNKAELQDVQVDSSEDVEIFGREIAPTLGITVRFAGEEPTDNVTRQYNETMKEILPRYGVEFCEIPRKEFDGEPISASKVRAALKVGDFDKIKKLVPKSTLQYLRKRTGQEVKEEPIVSDMTRQDLRSFIG